MDNEFLQAFREIVREEVRVVVKEEVRDIVREEVRGIVKAKVVSAVQLSAQQLEELRESLEKTTGKKILLELTIDKKLIGGLVVKIGDKIIDGSTSTKLKMLEKYLQNTSFEQE